MHFIKKLSLFMKEVFCADVWKLRIVLCAGFVLFKKKCEIMLHCGLFYESSTLGIRADD